MQPKPVEMNPTFLTNPAILISTYYEKTRQNETEEVEPEKRELEKREDPVQIKKVRSSKKKVVTKKEEPPVFFVQETIKLTFLNGKF
jgi:hypothetical protein